MIERAKKTDLEAIYALMYELENHTLDKAHFTSTFLVQLNNEDIVYLVARQDTILGFISLAVHHYLHHDHDTGEIVELVVRPECRGQQIGKQLLQAAEQIAVARGLEQLELATSTYRKRAHHFYEKNGYEMLHYNYTKNLPGYEQ